MNKLKFLIFACHSSDHHHGCSYTDLAEITLPTYKEYSQIHGYDFYVKTKGFNKLKSMGWPKIDVIIERIPFYDWIFYVETDSLLMNQTIRLENLIDNNYDMILTETTRQDKIQVNTGPMLVKCSEWSKDFLNGLLYKDKYWNDNMHEQGAINEEINQKKWIRNHISIRDLRFFNSFAHEWHKENNFQIGDFICHGAGSSNDYRVKLFTYLKNHIIKMPAPIKFKPFLNIGDEPI